MHIATMVSVFSDGRFGIMSVSKLVERYSPHIFVVRPIVIIVNDLSDRHAGLFARLFVVSDSEKNRVL